jgi:hypothetical protein
VYVGLLSVVGERGGEGRFGEGPEPSPEVEGAVSRVGRVGRRDGGPGRERKAGGGTGKFVEPSWGDWDGEADLELAEWK